MICGKMPAACLSSRWWDGRSHVLRNREMDEMAQVAIYEHPNTCYDVLCRIWWASGGRHCEVAFAELSPAHATQSPGLPAD